MGQVVDHQLRKKPAIPALVSRPPEETDRMRAAVSSARQAADQAANALRESDATIASDPVVTAGLLRLEALIEADRRRNPLSLFPVRPVASEDGWRRGFEAGVRTARMGGKAIVAWMPEGRRPLLDRLANAVRL